MFAVAAAAVVAVEWACGRPTPRIPSWLALILGAFLAWGLITCLWALDLPESLVKAAQLAGAFAAGLVLHGSVGGLEEEGRRRVRQGLLVGSALCAVTVAARVAVNPDIGHLLRGLVTRTPEAHDLAGINFLFLKAVSEVTSLLLWPTAIAAVAVWGRRGLWSVIAAFLAFILLTQSYTALAATSVGLAVFLLARIAFRATATVIVVGTTMRRSG